MVCGLNVTHAAFFTLVPLHMATSFDLSVSQLGLIFSVSSMSGLLGAPIGGMCGTFVSFRWRCRWLCVNSMCSGSIRQEDHSSAAGCCDDDRLVDGTVCTDCRSDGRSSYGSLVVEISNNNSFNFFQKRRWHSSCHWWIQRFRFAFCLFLCVVYQIVYIFIMYVFGGW